MASVIFSGANLEFVPFTTEGLYLWQTYGSDNVTPFDLVPGETYTIYWDNNEYQCVAVANEELKGMGNLALGGLGENTGEPFVIGINLDGSNTFCFSTEPGKHSLVIYRGVPGEGLVLKDRLGVDGVYKPAEKVRVPTESGGLQVFSKGEAITNVPIELDFSGGDQVVTAPDGQFVKSAVIYKPEGLVPENIAEGVDIAGILGTLTAGGGGGGSGGMSPLMFIRVGGLVQHYYTSSTSGSSSATVSNVMPGNAIIHAYVEFTGSGQTSSSSSTATGYINNGVFGSDFVSSTAQSNGTLLVSDSLSVTTTNKYSGRVYGSVIVFSIPGIYMYQNENGNLIIYADETVTVWPCGQSGGYGAPAFRNVTQIDLSSSNITNLPDYSFRYSGASQILLPKTITTVSANAFDNCATIAPSPVIVDFSKHTFVPTASGTITAPSGLKIRVPSALYNSWTSATYWTQCASIIESV